MKKTMKVKRKGWLIKLCLFTIMCGICGPVFGQEANEDLCCQTDMEFNHSKVAMFINGTFVKSLIGFDVNALGVTNVKKEECDSSLVVNGIVYERTCSITCPKTPNLVTLADIRKMYCPKLKGKVVFMINKFFITKDVESYKLDKDYILRCELLPSTEFGNFFSSSDPFTIIRVFTKTKANAYPIRIR